MLHDVIAGVSAGDPDGVALVTPDGVPVTWADLNSRVATVAARVAALVPVAGRVAAVGSNHRAWVELYYAVPAAGRVLVMLNHRLAPAELVDQVTRSGATVVFGAPEQLERLADAGVDPAMLRGWHELDEVDPTANPPAPPGRSGGSDRDPAWLLFTSGTTGTPKGAVLTHASLLAAVDASAGARPVDPDDIYLFAFPLCHVAGYNVVHRHAHGRPVVLMEGFEPTGFCRMVGEHGVTSCSLAATMLAALCDHLDESPDDLARLATLRVIAYGAAPMPVALLRRAHDLLGVDFTQGYGMTELSGNAVFLDAAAHRQGLAGDGSVLSAAGRPAPGVELRIVDRATDLEVPVGSVGEITVRGAQVMAGYWNDPETTASTVRDGWLYTGDVGRVDDDGMLWVMDRSKDVIITGGENVASPEVEQAVCAASGVASAAVVGVPDERWGENVCAVVVARPGMTVDPDNVVATVRQRLAGFKVPRHVVVVDSLPTNAAGKVVKAELRAWLAENPHIVGPRR
jgi:acyl-CoA synthetase (AMP-forming)/AMP-acid ligase II